MLLMYVYQVYLLKYVLRDLELYSDRQILSGKCVNHATNSHSCITNQVAPEAIFVNPGVSLINHRDRANAKQKQVVLNKHKQVIFNIDDDSDRDCKSG
jgi:hypothetical protein